LINVNLLPKHLRRVREPGYWRVIAVLFPLLVLGALGVVQFIYSQTERNLNAEKLQKETTATELQFFVDKQNEVQAQLEQVNILIGIRDQVQQNTTEWTNELAALLEMLPAGQANGRPSISFSSLTMQGAGAASADPNRYEGQTVVAEMNVSGDVVNTEVLAQFMKSLEDSEKFEAVFGNATRNEETGTYTYSMTIGAVGGVSNVEESESQ
jgi:type IV pilus assembly protein PilN